MERTEPHGHPVSECCSPELCGTATRGQTSLAATMRDVRIAKRIVKLLEKAHDWTWILEKVREEMEGGVTGD